MVWLEVTMEPIFSGLPVWTIALIGAVIVVAAITVAWLLVRKKESRK